MEVKQYQKANEHHEKLINALNLKIQSDHQHLVELASHINHHDHHVHHEHLPHPLLHHDEHGGNHHSGHIGKPLHH